MRIHHFAMATGNRVYVSSVYLQLRAFVLGELAGVFVGRVEVRPAVLGAVPVDVGWNRRVRFRGQDQNRG